MMKKKKKEKKKKHDSTSFSDSVFQAMEGTASTSKVTLEEKEEEEEDPVVTSTDNPGEVPVQSKNQKKKLAAVALKEQKRLEGQQRAQQLERDQRAARERADGNEV